MAPRLSLRFHYNGLKMEKISILLVEDHTIVRQGLRMILDQNPSIEVIAEAVNGRDAIRMAEKYRPDIILMDFSMPDLNGLEATRQLVRLNSEVKVIILTRHGNQEYVDRLLRAGASGYLIKNSAADELILAIQAVYRGSKYLDPTIASGVIDGYLKPKHHQNGDMKKLTPRQREVLQLIAEGHPNRDIASKLHISVKTVENHRANIMKALDLSTTADLIQYAIRTGVIIMDD